MVRLSVDIVLNASRKYNALDQYSLNLRDLGIGMIENLGVTKDQYDCIDLSNNILIRLENFPKLERLTNLILNNNKISKIDSEISNSLPNLESLVLSSNEITTLGDLDSLKGLKKLRILILLSNDVRNREHYKSYIINLLPSLKMLDTLRITQKDRKIASDLFAGEQGVMLMERLRSSKFTLQRISEPNMSIQQPSKADSIEQKRKDKIKQAILNATSMEEVERLEELLATGQDLEEFTNSNETLPVVENVDNDNKEDMDMVNDNDKVDVEMESNKEEDSIVNDINFREHFKSQTLNKCKVKDLKDFLNKMNIKFPKKAKKSELVELSKGYFE